MFFLFQILERIENINLVQEKARYHKDCYRNFFLKRTEASSSVGRPKTTEVEEAMKEIIDYLDQNSEECQFSLSKVKEAITGHIPDDRTIKRELEKFYGGNIIITSLVGRPPIITFKDDCNTLMYKQWSQKEYSNDPDSKEERIMTVQKAAEIIRQDIRSRAYETEFYPSPDSFLDNAEMDIPDSLMCFLETIIAKNKRDKSQLNCKIISIAHAIVAATRPRSFVSSILTALSTFLGKTFGSRKLISLLSYLGFCVSYDESLVFESSSVLLESLNLKKPDKESFVQFVFDNADANTNTLDGLNSFHAMGGIQCITPPRKNVVNTTFLRTTNNRNTASGSFGHIPLQYYNKGENSLKAIQIKDVRDTTPTKMSPPHLTWMIGKYLEIPNLKGWNGFMAELTERQPYKKSEILTMPFINQSPSDNNTIYTAILEAVKKCPEHQKTTFVTFDQPLYIKAKQIVSDPSSGLSNVIVRLGGFHLLMSYMGSIGFIMSGSGLQELWKIIYAAASTDVMMKGHAYARALRAHLLTQEALCHVIFSETDFSSGELDAVAQIFSEEEIKIPNDETIENLDKKFNEKLESLKSNGPTAQLWLQYIEMVTLIRDFIQAERTGNWNLHLVTIAKMLPYFCASGHFHYAKCAHLYLQEMSTLKETLPGQEYEKFTKEGLFTIRRSDRFWSGLWSDLTIEQTLMRTMKSQGGLTRGRGITENVLFKWVHSMPTAHKVIESLESFARIDGTHEASGLVDSRPSRLKRDSEDLRSLINWIRDHPPFQISEKLFSLSTGIIGDTQNINCHNSKNVGHIMMEKNLNKTFDEVKFQRKDRVLPLSSVNSYIKVNDVETPIEPLTLFQRISFTKRTQEELKSFFQYELAPYPLSMFDKSGMRKGKKSSLYDMFTPIQNSSSLLTENTIYVIDGGHLLHKVVWQKGELIGDICKRYVEYVTKHYGSDSIVVFDGYPDDATNSTKSAERNRRQRYVSSEILFEPTMPVTVTKDIFLQSSKNKDRIINFLKGYMLEAGIQCEQATEDADTLIVATAFKNAANKTNDFVIVGEDVDLIVLYVDATVKYSYLTNVYFLKPSKQNQERKLFDRKCFAYPDIAKNLLFLHAISGCDTTSALFMQGKKKYANILTKHEDLNDEVKVFREPETDIRVLEKVGQKFLVLLYGGDTDMSLNDLRFKNFSSYLIKSKTNLACLPPTEAAANQHIRRTYLQVQKWLGRDSHISPLQYGWKRTFEGIVAIPTTLEAAAPELLKLISCNCQKGCQKSNCGCRKAGLKCSVICGFCGGESCSNIEARLDDDEENVLDDIDYTQTPHSEYNVEPNVASTSKRSKLS